MKYICSHGETWDLPAFNRYGNEFMCDFVRNENSYEFADVVAFDGGEVLELSDRGLETVATITPPWEESQYILPGWS
jgi:hypothetical protein